MKANRILPITLVLVLLAAVPTVVRADSGWHGHGNHDATQQQQNRFGNNRVADDDNNNQGNDNEQGDDNNNGGCNNSGAARNDGNEGNRNGGYQNGGCSNNQNGQRLQGIITAVNGNSITILRGLVPISFDASQAINNRNVNGSLYISRSITAYGYYDSNNHFHATSIR